MKKKPESRYKVGDDGVAENERRERDDRNKNRKKKKKSSFPHALFFLFFVFFNSEYLLGNAVG
jgi:hypothetical protein